MKAEILLWYCAAVSLLAAAVTILDKQKARRGEWRVSENALMLLAALGGSAAMLLVMLLIRHKTRHVKFLAGIPILMALQLPLVLWILRRFGVL